MSQPASQLQVLVVSDRAAIRSFFASLPLAVTTIDAAVPDVQAHAGDPRVVLVDLGTEPGKGEQLCSDLHARYPSAAIVAVVCCQQSVGFWHLHALLGSAISGMIDLHATPDEATRAITSAARGSSVVHLQLGREQQSFLRDVLIRRDGRSETRLRVLTLVSRGLPDHEIGRRLHLSPHTVKHYVEQLREELGVRNRIELASWSGRAGLYTADDA
jgi:DNA-binding NarL/FixJ family response regulator